MDLALLRRLALLGLPLLAASPVRADTPEPPRWVVYFGPGSAALDGEAVRSLRAAAEAVVRERGELAIVGHADSRGARAYNGELSRRRAATVEAELHGLGVPELATTVDWRGENAPAVAAGDEVDERLNRRVEVTLRIRAE